ncbi:hypothetical protein MKX03_019271 [Papaver bracteatum]|nr:hypothetical protein MKX03_019271 [Papaver bracteatum]
MLLRASSSTDAISLSTSAVDNVNQFPSSSSSVSFSSQRRTDGFVMSISKSESNNRRPVTGVVFEPFEEVKKELQLVPDLPQQSITRHKFIDDCEASINEKINVEYNVSYVYHALYVYFDRDNVSLRGFAKFFKEASVEEREHAELLREYQNRRGGKVKMQSILMPLYEFDHPEKGDALHGDFSPEKFNSINAFHLNISEWVSSTLLADVDWKRMAEPVMQLYTERTDGSRILYYKLWRFRICWFALHLYLRHIGTY